LSITPSVCVGPNAWLGGVDRVVVEVSSDA
jgi:hypothetical protein